MLAEPNLRFKGKTYVAFSDLCGFKKMAECRDTAYRALDHLFQSVYNLQADNDTSIKGLAVSDCVISWVSDRNINCQTDKLMKITDFVCRLHKEMIQENYLMITTIAWGDFEYHDRLLLQNLQKEMIMGGAYLTAFLANDKVPEGAIVLLDEGLSSNTDMPYHGKWNRLQKPAGWEYFWSASNDQEIETIITERSKAQNLKFQRLIDIYRGHWNPHQI